MPMSRPKIVSALIAYIPLCVLAQATPELPPPGEALPAVPSTSAPQQQGRASRPAEQHSFLDAQSEMDRRKMLDKQQRTFQLEVDGRYAKALKAYCDTGYGDERCFHAETGKPAPVIAALPTPLASSVVPAKESRDLPAVAQISGFGEELNAILVFSGGKRMRVGTRSQLPGGEIVVSIRPGEVLVSRSGDGKTVPLLFQGSD